MAILPTVPETLAFDTATSGDYGDRTDQDADLVERDVWLGYVTPELVQRCTATRNNG